MSNNIKKIFINAIQRKNFYEFFKKSFEAQISVDKTPKTLYNSAQRGVWDCSGRKDRISII